MTRTRSIGARSDWTNGGDKTPAAASTAAPSVTGGDDEDGDDETANGDGIKMRQYSIYKEDPAEAGPKESNDDHITKYVQEQLQRLKTNESNEFSEEIAASGDGTNEK